MNWRGLQRGVALASLVAAATLATTAAGAAQEPSEEQRQAFRAAKTGAVAVSQSYPGADGVSLPVEEVAARLLGHCGLVPAGPGTEADLVLSISLQGFAEGAEYNPGPVYLYTGARVHGLVRVSAASVPGFGAIYDVKYEPEYLVEVRPGSPRLAALKKPSGAPFREALAAPESLFAVLMATLRQAFGPDVVANALDDKDADVRMVAALDLVSIRDARAAPVLIAFLRGNDLFRRQHAADALGELRDPVAVPPLIAALRGADWDLREPAAGALGAIGDARAVPPLIQALKSQDPSLRIRAAGALGEIGDRSAVPALIAALRHPDEYTRESAAEALRTLTGQDFGEDPAQWRAWWEQNKATLAPKQ